MSSLKDMSPEELAALGGDATPDIPASASNSIVLLQPNSPQLSSSSDGYAEGAAAGDFLSYARGRPIVIDGSTGFNFVPIGFELSWPEFAPNRAGFVTNHPQKPANAVWLRADESPDGKAGLFLPNSNRVEQTISAFMLVLDGGEGEESVEPYPAVFSFRSASLGGRARALEPCEPGQGHYQRRRDHRPDHRHLAVGEPFRDARAAPLAEPVRGSGRQARRGARPDARSGSPGRPASPRLQGWRGEVARGREGGAGAQRSRQR